jgi:hypothetical protein
VTAPRRTPARVGKGASKTATIPRASAVASTKRVRARSPANARKRRVEAPSPAPQSGMQLHTTDGTRKYLTADRVDLAAGVLVFESLKKRRTGISRSVPVPPALLDLMTGYLICG